MYHNYLESPMAAAGAVAMGGPAALMVSFESTTESYGLAIDCRLGLR